MPSHWNNLFNSDPYYDMFRRDIDTCCEIAIRYGLIVNEKKGLLIGGRNIYEESFLNEFRVARLFEAYFGKGCLDWDPPGRGGRLGEFLLKINSNPSIFVEVKTKEERSPKAHSKVKWTNVKSIRESLKSAYRKVDDNLNMPFLVVLSHDHFYIPIDAPQVIEAYLGLITYQNGNPEVISYGFCSPQHNRKLSAIGNYYFYVNPKNNVFEEHFEVFHNHYANIRIDKGIFVNKADKQFYLPEWNGKFTDV